MTEPTAPIGNEPDQQPEPAPKPRKRGRGRPRLPNEITIKRLQAEIDAKKDQISKAQIKLQEMESKLQLIRHAQQKAAELKAMEERAREQHEKVRREMDETLKKARGTDDAGEEAAG